MPSLRRAEAAERSALIRPVSYRVRLDLGADEATFTSLTRIEFDARANAQTFVDVKPQSLRGAVLNGVALDLDSAFSAADGRLQLTGLQECNDLAVDAVVRLLRPA